MRSGSVTAKHRGPLTGSVSDRSLDEFLSGGDDAGDVPPEDTSPDAGGGDDDHSTTRDCSASGADVTVDPVRPTMRWSPDDEQCDACGATASRRWRDGERFVCPACKEWS